MLSRPFHEKLLGPSSQTGFRFHANKVVIPVAENSMAAIIVSQCTTGFEIGLGHALAAKAGLNRPPSPHQWIDF